MLCRSCGAELIPGKSFCHACGARVPPHCPQCGAEIQPGFRFCPDCGFQLDAPGADPAAAASSRALSTMPEGLVEKIRASGGTLAGERKQVTVLFCDLAGSTAVASGLDPEEYRELLEQYVALALHEVYRFEGIVNQLAGDGFMALFGAPIAHEDAPQRAVRAALAIRDGLAHFNQQLEGERGISLPARIGINSGPVVVGTVGNDLKMDYTAIGDTTNLASRLESLARPGTIVISESTARLVRGFFELRAVGPLAVKGKTEPIGAYEVLDAHPHASPMAVAAERGLTPFVGRDVELAMLEGCYQRLSGRLTQVVAVAGDAGSGKSRLIYEFKQRLAGEPAVFFEARCAALSQIVPLHPFVGMLRQYFELAPGETTECACDKVSRRLRESPEKLDAAYPLLCRVLSLPTVEAADVPLEALKREMFQAVTSLVIGESRRAPVVVIVEDLHWIDEPSEELLGMAIQRLVRAPVMVLVSHRPDYRPSWKTTAALTVLSLRPLLDDDVVQITRALAGGALPPELERRILTKAEGSPFFAEEITRALIEEGYLAGDDGGGARVTRPVEEIVIPGTVREVIAARLDRLGAPAKRVAQVAAVLGRQFTRRQLDAVLAGEGIELDRELAELQRRGIIHRKSLFSDDEYRFGESLTQEVAYEGLLNKQRRHLHERVAALLEGGADGDALARPSLIAHHYALSDNRAKAVETLLRAAAEAERLPSYRTALELVRQAWEIAEAALRERADPDPRFRRWIMEATLGYARMTVLYGSSGDTDAERAAARGCELAAELGDAAASIALCTMHGMLLSSDRERFAEGVALTEQAVEMAKQSGTELQVIGASRAVAWDYLLDGRFAAAREKIEWVLAELDRHGQAESLSDVYMGARWMRDGIAFHSDDLDAALRFAAETYQLALQASNRTVQCSAAGLLALMDYGHAHHAEAREWADRAMETAEAIGSAATLHRAAALALAARVQLGETGNLARYIDLIEEGIGYAGNVILSINLIVETLLALGDLKRAERLARQAQEQAAGRLREMLAAAALGRVAVHLGPAQWHEAERWLDRAQTTAQAIGARSTLAAVLAAKGHLALERHETGTAAAHWQGALALYDELHLVHYRRAIDCALAGVGGANGQAAAAPTNATASGRNELTA